MTTEQLIQFTPDANVMAQTGRLDSQHSQEKLEVALIGNMQYSIMLVHLGEFNKLTKNRQDRDLLDANNLPADGTACVIDSRISQEAMW